MPKKKSKAPGKSHRGGLSPYVGRTVKNKIKPINASPEEIAKAISLDADKKLDARRKIKI